MDSKETLSFTYLTTVFSANTVAGLSATADMNNWLSNLFERHVLLGTKAVLETAAANSSTAERTEENRVEQPIVSRQVLAKTSNDTNNDNIV